MSTVVARYSREYGRWMLMLGKHAPVSCRVMVDAHCGHDYDEPLVFESRWSAYKSGIQMGYAPAFWMNMKNRRKQNRSPGLFAQLLGAGPKTAEHQKPV